MSISFTMLHYRRPDNVLRIANRVASWGRFEPVSVVCPEGSVALPTEGLSSGINVITGYPNTLTCRFHAAVQQGTEYCLLTDDDFEFDPSWLDAALARLEGSPNGLVAGSGRTPHRRGGFWLYNYRFEQAKAVFGLPPYLARRETVARVFDPSRRFLRMYCETLLNCEDLLLSSVSESLQIEPVYDHGFTRLEENDALAKRRTHWFFRSLFLNVPHVRRVIRQRQKEASNGP